MADERDSDDSDEIKLSASTLAALQEFYAEQSVMERCVVQEAQSPQDSNPSDVVMPSEDWQLSQFWYDDYTATLLAKEALFAVNNSGRIACISCPTLYARLHSMNPADCAIVCLEFDQRFLHFGDSFVFYDYNEPVALPAQLKASFDLVVVDPPFLSEECLQKIAQTVHYLTTKKILLCTGAVMTELAQQLLGVTECSFRPSHINKLANEFCCYANYKTSLLHTSDDNRRS